MAFAYLVVGDDSAQDLLQEAFVRAFSRFAHIRSPEAFRTYLKRTIVNQAHDRHRKARREEEASTRAGGTWISSDSPEARVDLRVLLTDLPPRQRAALVLRFYEDLTYGDVGHTLGCSAGAAKKLVRRALDQLKVVIEEESDE